MVSQGNDDGGRWWNSRTRSTLLDSDHNSVWDNADAQWSLNYFARLASYLPTN